MNKKKQVILSAAMLLALSGVSLASAEDGKVVWVLTGSASEDGRAQYIAVADPNYRPREKKAAPVKAPAAQQAAEMPAIKAVPSKAKNEAPKAKKPEAVKVKKAPEKKTAEGETVDSAISAENPLIVKADRMMYNQTTGDMEAKGSVDITHMQDRYETERIYGNSQSQQYVIPEAVKWTTPGTEMTASSGTYDGGTAVAHFDGISGWSEGTYYFEGESAEFDRNANVGLVQKGYFTTKHAVAKVPDYRIEADTIDIYPNDHYTAHNASLFIKNTRLISLPSYSGSLKNGVSMWSLIPRPAYDSDNGFGLRSRFRAPIGGAESDLYFNMSLAWYTKAGFKPDIGFEYETAPGVFRLRYVKEESTLNDDHVWVEKKPSFSFDSRHFYIPGTDFYVGAGGEIGEWKQGHIEGSHKMWDVYISHTPITLGPHLTFDWRAGFRKDYYGYNDAIRRNQYYSVGLTGNYGIWRSWIRYTDNDLKGKTPYHYDTYDMDKPLTVGARVQLTKLDALSVSYSIDTIDGHLEHRDYTYYRDMHSFYGWITYRDIDDEWKVMIQPKDFSF